MVFWAAWPDLNGLVRPKIVLIQSLEPAAVIVRVRYYMHIKYVISPAIVVTMLGRTTCGCFSM